MDADSDRLAAGGPAALAGDVRPLGNATPRAGAGVSHRSADVADAAAAREPDAAARRARHAARPPTATRGAGDASSRPDCDRDAAAQGDAGMAGNAGGGARRRATP